jgi:hypothetical protein
MSRLPRLAALLSIAAVAAACGSVTTRQERVSATLALAPGAAQFLAPSSIALRRAEDGTVRLGAAPPARDQAESRAVAPEARRALLEGASASVWTESIVHGYCRVPEPPGSRVEAPPPLPVPPRPPAPR